jgi:hypothetical protein
MQISSTQFAFSQTRYDQPFVQGQARYTVPVPNFWSQVPGAVEVSVDGVPLDSSQFSSAGRLVKGGVPVEVQDRLAFAVVLNPVPDAAKTVSIQWVNRVLPWADIWPTPVYGGPTSPYAPDLTLFWLSIYNPKNAPPPVNHAFTNAVMLPALPEGYSYELWRRTHRGGGLDQGKPHRHGRRYTLYRTSPPTGVKAGQSPWLYGLGDLIFSHAATTQYFKFCVYREIDGARSALMSSVICASALRNRLNIVYY